jgi:uncharacterized membrane protein YkvA (DUF1232 family)
MAQVTAPPLTSLRRDTHFYSLPCKPTRANINVDVNPVSGSHRREGDEMTLKLVIDLSDADLEYYRQYVDATWRRNAQRDEKDLVDGARQLLQQSRQTEAPECVRKRLDDLGTLLAMLEDPEWPLEAADRQRIVVAISYFADPSDMIPDKIPGLGFLDDALMAELVIRELKHDLEGYRDFCAYREKQEALRGKDAKVSRGDWLAAKRRQIFLRIKRRQLESRRHGSRDGPTDPILRYQ